MWLPSFHVHLDVLTLVVVLEGGYVLALRRWGPSAVQPGERPASRGQITAFSFGVLTILLAASWPMHDLAEHDLLSVHMVQHLLLSLVAPPLLIAGTPPWLLRRVLAPRPFAWAMRHLARPVVAFVLFNGVVVFTHWSGAMEVILTHHWVHFLAHAALFLTASLMWWQVMSPLPEYPALSYPARILYLFLQSLLPTVPASFLTFGHSPLYAFYAEAPRVWGMSALTDQLVAGLLMKIVAGAILWVFIAIFFFRWWHQEQDANGWDALEYHDVERDLRKELTRR